MRIKTLLPAMAVAIVVPVVSFWTASGRSITPDRSSTRSDSRPAATVEPIPGTSVRKVVLSARAAERLGIEMAPVGEMERPLTSQPHTGLTDRAPSPAASKHGGPRTVIPYSAVLYDPHGDTWVYTSPEPLVFVRHRVSIDYTAGGRAVLSDGPAPGTMIVTVGGTQLYGAELSGPESEVGE